jgi:hypothetical protein
MNEIILQRTIPVRCWHVIGRVARASKRTELMPLLFRARECGETTIEDVSEHLLFEPRSRRVVAQRLLHIAASYGLLSRRERGFRLTDAGAAALASEDVFVPEHGTWTVWTSDDPLLHYPVLRVEPWDEPSAFDELRGKDQEKTDRKPVETPRTLRDAVGRIEAPPAGTGARLRIDELEPKGEEVETDASLRILWDVSGRRMRLEGLLAGADVSTALEAPSLSAPEAWLYLLDSEGLGTRWDARSQALLVGFAETTVNERDSMRRELLIGRPMLPHLGAFDSVTISGVALKAAAAPDAALWAAWRLRARVGEYATSDRFAAWSCEAASPFAEFRPATPSRPVLAAEAWRARGERPTPTTWHLVAAEDWSL